MKNGIPLSGVDPANRRADALPPVFFNPLFSDTGSGESSEPSLISAP